MAIQTENLVMAALGVVNDQPPNSIQPRLADGVHLRFAFAPERGFPWYGFYLFRRRQLASEPECLQAKFNRDWKAGPWSGRDAAFSGGLFRSDVDLAFLDQFAPAGSPEFDLRGRKQLRFELPTGEETRQFYVRLGILGKDGAGVRPTGRKCVEFSALKPGLYPNPYLSAEVEFTLAGSKGGSVKNCEIRQSANTTGLVCLGQLTAKLPVLASAVQVDLFQTSPSTSVVALDRNGNIITRKIAAARDDKQTIELSGSAIAGVKVMATRGTLVLSLCYSAQVPDPPLLGPIKLRGFHGQVPVAQTTVSGRAGDVVTAVLSADAMTWFEIEGGPAALIDICTVSILDDLARGWTPLINQPLCLPVEQPDYPCPGKPATFVQAASLAQSRILYGPAAPWAGQNYADLNGILTDLVVNGPAGQAMVDRTKAYRASGSDDPGIPKLGLLDVVLLSSLNPAVAMMLGLYWIDTTAQPGNTYDYMVVADHAGQFHGDPTAALTALAAVTPQASLPDDVDVWITFGKKLELAPPLAPPGVPQVYALPGASTGGNASVASGGRNMAGLTWEINATADGELLPDAPVGYHLWRVNLGLNQPTSAPPSSAYSLLTGDRLIVATETALPSGVTPERASDWPPFPLQAFDPGLADGWYGYCLSAVDLFGRHSLMGPPGPWLQWAWPAPTPESPAPKPWYYIDPPAERQINPFAVRLLDKTAPPRVPGVEADALDPADKMLLRDAAYNAWWSAIEPTWWNSLGANQDNVLPIRVRWKWTAAQMLQAPDTKEFRIYFNPGTIPPADYTDSDQWQERISVVDYAEYVSLTIDSDGLPLRLYEVLLPVPNGPAFPGVSLTPSEINPIDYAHVSVSAADDKQHTPDNSKWNATILGNRPGNEGKVGVPAKIYRVLRSKPPAPAAVDESEKVWATKADYHSCSYYTFRWAKSDTYKAHIFRALDDTLFQTDWERRQQGALSLDPTDLDSFPIPTWTQPTRDAIEAELNSLPIPAASALFDKAARAAYDGLSNDALRTLAGLPGNEAAFSQITYLALDPADASNADRPGLDGADSYTPSASLCAYTAELDGRATNRYFFRAAYVNAALTVGPLGPSSPVVYLPKVQPPRRPVITTILGDNSQITLYWAANRESNLAGYRVYRTNSKDKTRDTRLMERVTDVAAEIVQYSDPVPGLVPFYYRLGAFDSAGNESPATPAVMASAFDISPPIPAVITSAKWGWSDGAQVFHEWNDPVPKLLACISVEWQSVNTVGETLIQRQLSPHSAWTTLTPYQVAFDRYYDIAVDVSKTYSYRVVSRSRSGQTVTAAEVQITPP